MTTKTKGVEYASTRWFPTNSVRDQSPQSLVQVGLDIEPSSALRALLVMARLVLARYLSELETHLGSARLVKKLELAH
jgi:hypothetical protein